MLIDMSRLLNRSAKIKKEDIEIIKDFLIKKYVFENVDERRKIEKCYDLVYYARAAQPVILIDDLSVISQLFALADEETMSSSLDRVVKKFNDAKKYLSDKEDLVELCHAKLIWFAEPTRYEQEYGDFSEKIDALNDCIRINAFNDEDIKFLNKYIN